MTENQGAQLLLFCLTLPIVYVVTVVGSFILAAMMIANTKPPSAIPAPRIERSTVRPQLDQHQVDAVERIRAVDAKFSHVRDGVRVRVVTPRRGSVRMPLVALEAVKELIARVPAPVAGHLITTDEHDIGMPSVAVPVTPADAVRRLPRHHVRVLVVQPRSSLVVASSDHVGTRPPSLIGRQGAWLDNHAGNSTADLFPREVRGWTHHAWGSV